MLLTSTSETQSFNHATYQELPARGALYVILLGQSRDELWHEMEKGKCMLHFGWKYKQEPNVDLRIILKLNLKYL
jgi:hypothetical protein